MTTARRGLGGCGTQSSGLAFGGFTTGVSNAQKNIQEPLLQLKQ
jgi:hypothetical protein